MAHLVKSGGLQALKDDPFVDFTVKCVDRAWKVHRTTLCGDSPALMLHCTQMMEAEKRELDLHEADPQAVECLLEYQYLGSYEDVNLRSARQPFVSESEADDLQPPSNTVLEHSSLHEVPARAHTSQSASPALIWKCKDAYPAISTMAAMDIESVTAILLLNINVFELAQRFGLPSLEEYAIQKLMEKEQCFSSCQLDKVLSLVFEVTAHDDMKLRHPIFLRCVENHKLVRSMPKTVEQLQSGAFTAWTFALEAQQELADKDDLMRRQKSAHKTELRIQEKASSREARDLRRTIRQRDDTIEKLEDDVRNLERKLEKAKKESRRLRQRFNFWGHA